MSAAIDLTLALLSEGVRGDWIALFFGVWFVLLPIIGAAAIASTVLDMVNDRRRRRQNSRAQAMRRHPSARTTMSDAERRYHGSDAWGR